MAEMMYREALNRALFEEMRRDPSVFVMGENIGMRGGSYKVTEGLIKEFGPERVIDTPLAEATFTNAAVGAALVGTRPIVEILFVDFTTLVMDAIVNQAAKYKFMSGPHPTMLTDCSSLPSGMTTRRSSLSTNCYT
jgi:pyruvate/2-oxoglutarate/acetoin dehydrogenase E1 component